MDWSGIPERFRQRGYFTTIQDDIRLTVEVSQTIEQLLRRNFLVRKLINDVTFGNVIKRCTLSADIKRNITVEVARPRNKLVREKCSFIDPRFTAASALRDKCETYRRSSRESSSEGSLGS